MRSLLHQSGIRREKGFSTVSLLFVMLVLPVIRQSLCAVWSGKFFENFVRAQKDTYYRFPNHPCFNRRKPVTLVACREIARTDRTPFNEKTLIVDDTVVGKTGENMELVSYHHDHTPNWATGCSAAGLPQRDPFLSVGYGFPYLREPAE